MAVRKVGWLQGRDGPELVLTGLRKIFDITQDEMAGAIGISQPTISDYERGQRIPAKRRVLLVNFFKMLGRVKGGLTPVQVRLVAGLHPDQLSLPYEEVWKAAGGDRESADL